MALRTPVISLLLIPTLIAPPGWAQSAATNSPQASTLQIKVVESDGTQLPVNSRGSKGFSFQVMDESGAGVPEAAVAVRLPDSGASGLFADGSHSGVVYTDATGKAHVDGIVWNSTAGSLMVRVTATKGEAHAGILVEQVLVAGTSPVAPAPALTAPRLETPVAASVAAAAAPSVSVTSTASNDDAPLNTIGTESAPIRPAIRASVPGADAPFLRSAEPSVSISNDGSGPAYHGSSSKKKWIMIGLAIVAGAGAAYAVSALAKGSSTSTGSSSINIGAPTVSVGHP